MSIVLQPKHKYQPQPKYPISHRNILNINIFLNEKISRCMKSQPPSSPQANIRMLTLPYRYPQLPTSTRSQTERHSASSFRQILRHTACRSAMARRITPMIIVSKDQPKEAASPPRKISQAIHLQKRSIASVVSDYSEVRKQIQKRFERTKMILKEEAKMKKFQKIQQIYQHKFKSIARPSPQSPSLSKN